MHGLLVNVAAIPAEGIGWRLGGTVSELGIDHLDVTMAQPLDIECHLVRVHREVVVRGALRTAVRLSCSRCDEEFVLPLTLALDAIYLPAVDLSSERAKELDDEITDVYAYGESVIDLVEMVRDKLLLSIPLQPHCAAGCKGLCPSCGVNRNAVHCQCAEEKLGSPFELLKELRFS